MTPFDTANELEQGTQLSSPMTTGTWGSSQTKTTESDILPPAQPEKGVSPSSDPPMIEDSHEHVCLRSVQDSGGSAIFQSGGHKGLQNFNDRGVWQIQRYESVCHKDCRDLHSSPLRGEGDIIVTDLQQSKNFQKAFPKSHTISTAMTHLCCIAGLGPSLRTCC